MGEVASEDRYKTYEDVNQRYHVLLQELNRLVGWSAGAVAGDRRLGSDQAIGVAFPSHRPGTRGSPPGCPVSSAPPKNRT
jgi:hypothetical protein